MATTSRWKTTPDDLRILRDLAKRQLEISHDPVMNERRRLWTQHNDLHDERPAQRGEAPRGKTGLPAGGHLTGGTSCPPLVLCESGGVRDEFLPDSKLQCKEDWARNLERSFRLTIYHHENVKDDSVVDDHLRCNWSVRVSDYGVSAKIQRGEDSQGRRLGYRWEHPIRDLHSEADKLHPRTYSVDREATAAWKAHLEEVFQGILPVQIRGSFWWTVGMTWPAINLIGLENLMVYMVDQPEALHRLMAFLRDDHIAYAQWLEREGLLTLNNGNDYIGSGSRGFTTHLPQPDWKEGAPVHLKDLWVLSESQETVGISPAMFAEFIFPYQLAVVEKFGLTYYGCCEPVHNRWDSIKKFPNLRSVSVSPWCDEAFMAEALGRNHVYSRKPAPALISTARFDEDAIRADLRNTLRLAKNCNVELVMKDVHHLNNQPQRMGRWVELAREVIAESA